MAASTRKRTASAAKIKAGNGTVKSSTEHFRPQEAARRNEAISGDAEGRENGKTKPDLAVWKG